METVRRWARAAAAACLGLAVAGCAPLTFSNEAALDFERYRSVRVEVLPTTQHASYAALYLAGRLEQTSGFTRVTLSDRVPVDVVLEVDVSVNVEIHTDEEGDIETEYAGVATYFARTPPGAVLDTGTEQDASVTELEVIEDLLDEIEYRYFAPYRY